jgi:hypothetical protein
MPARKRPPDGANWHPEQVRARIRATELINRLQSHIFDGLELSLSQVNAINILLRKCVPDLTSTAVVADITHRYVVELPPMLSREEWEKKYSIDHLNPLPDPLKITNGSGNLQ